MASILFYLSKYPSTQQKLHSLLDSAMPNGPSDWTYEKTKSITFIDDIINEVLRLKPALLTGGYRVTPPKKGLQIDEVHIPGDTNVFVPIQLIQTDERYNSHSLEFIPERWGERREEMGTDGAPYYPFSIGPYSCPGKNLAIMSLRIAVSTVMQRFRVGFAKGESGEKFDKEAMDTFTTTLPPLQVEFQRR
jgi:cytochrome P450